MPTLLVYCPEKEKRWTLQVPAEQFVIGRSHEADVCIPLPSISKRHVVLQKKGPRFLFKDLGSKNGVYINGFRQDHGSVVDGDEIRLGSVVVTFYRDKPPEEPAGESRGPSGTLAEILAVGLGDEEQGVDPRRFESTETLVLPAAKPSRAAPQTDPRGAPAPEGTVAASAEKPPHAKEPEEPEGDTRGPSGAKAETATTEALEKEPAGEVPERPLPAQGSAHHGFKASRVRPAPRGLPAPALFLAMVFCAGVGFLLGHMSSYLDSTKGPAGKLARPGGKGPPPAPDAGSAAVASAPAAARKPENPLGPRASLKDPLAARRLILRLYLDIAGRTPTRDELKEALSLSLENIWVKVDSRRAVAFDAPEKEIEDAFPRFLGRKASASEKAAILELARGDPKYFAFYVATSEAYASASHRRARKPEQLARSLLTDLCDVVPLEAETRQALEALKAAKKGIEEPAQVIVQSRKAAAGPRAGESKQSWIQEAHARFLQRFPSPEEEKSALAQLEKGPEGWRGVLLGLACRGEYKDY